MAESVPRAPAVVAPGNHDGVHLGHQALLDEAKRVASHRGGLAVVALFFDPHPAQLLSPGRAPTPLTTIERRVELLQHAGADRAVAQPFDRAFSALAPEAFTRDVLQGRLEARHVVVGPDFRFGKGAVGDTESLRVLGDIWGFGVSVVEPVLLRGERVSSTAVRARLQGGDVAAATTMLTRVHEVSGVVVHGDERGRTIGFPTANLDCDPVLLPADGVYAVMVRRLGADDGAPLMPGVANLGVRPTFGAGRSVEVHLLSFSGDLYGERLRVGFVDRIRGERRFDGLEALRRQIGADEEQARRLCASAGKDSLRCL